jgi:alpha-D-ribose 1-methylphosphonate 5-triphosphate synthase subunit PhnH
MAEVMIKPQQSAHESQTLATFHALMWASSYPGTVYQLPTPNESVPEQAMLAIAEALIDLETSYYCGESQLAAQLAQFGARAQPADRAMYQFYPQLNADALSGLRHAPNGTLRDPDQSATIVVACTLGTGEQFMLHGPGIRGGTMLQAGGIPSAFWSLRSQAIRYPLGWDIILVDGQHVVCLPRTTSIERTTLEPTGNS